MAMQGLSTKLDEASWAELQSSQLQEEVEFDEGLGEEMDRAQLDQQDNTLMNEIFDRFHQETRQAPPSSSALAAVTARGPLANPAGCISTIAGPVAVALPLQPPQPQYATTQSHLQGPPLTCQLLQAMSPSPAAIQSQAGSAVLSVIRQRAVSSASGAMIPSSN
mmetsp:Transcript_15934/g.31840  ORF Transcript_15934/g.31840 Transcript_15934/m.31840 type:complete len:164 (-) Transcript_15934:786-1277(-)